MNESQIKSEIRKALGRESDLVLWNLVQGGAQIEHRTRRFGLVPGACDLIGILTLEVDVDSPEVHRTYGLFFALEVKTASGRVSLEQELFIRLVQKRGGFACVVRSVEEARAALDRARNGECC